MQLIRYEHNTDGVTLYTDANTRLRLQAYRDNVIRLSYTESEFADGESDIVIAAPCAVDWRVEDSTAELCFFVGQASLRIRKATFAMTLQRDERRLVSFAPCGLQLRKTTVTVPHYHADRDTGDKLKCECIEELPGYRFYLSLDLLPEEQIYGLGQHGIGAHDRRTCTTELYQMNNTAPVPFFVSSRGWGILVDTGAYSTFSRDTFGTTFYTEAVDMGDVYLCATARIDDAIGCYRALTGAVPMMPKWLFGYAQSKEHYHTQQELLSVLREYRRRRVPLDLIVQDWNYWQEGTWSDKSFDATRYPDPAGMCDEIHAAGAHVMISVWPNTRGGECFRQLFERDQLMTDSGTFGGGGLYNVFDDGACDTYWSQLEQIRRCGFDAFWCDATEPFENGYGDYITPNELRDGALARYKTWFDSRRINVFSLLHSRNVYEHHRRATAEQRVVNLTRSGYAGQQRYGTVVWSGDIGGSFEELRRQISEGLHFCASGLPYWSLDIGGFFPSHGEATFNSGVPYRSVTDNGYRELYTRWLQLGCFLPVMRSHGTTFPREIWRFGEPGDMFYDAILKFIELRYRLLPYIYSTAWQVTSADETFIRLLAFDFPEDARALREQGSYLFGRSLLVSPVTEAQYFEGADTPCDHPHTKQVYLPAGADWYDFWTGERHRGGQEITVPTPIDSMPLFVRAGSIIPTAPVMQYADEIPDAPYTLTVYPGADAHFTLYEDSGDGYAYEKGEYAEVDVTWNDATATLKISDRRGSFPSLVQKRELHVQLVNGQIHTILYDGNAQVMRME
ncbi:MAG: DUF5110 domain-containing protein [Clostridia bacterium]|nr:DUF5110 domain-containing protein [Clostridia bacterium]